MKKLLQDIEDHTRRQREAFLRASTEEVDGEEELKYLIVAKEPGSFKRRVHMPGYPGYEGQGMVGVAMDKQAPMHVREGPGGRGSMFGARDVWSQGHREPARAPGQNIIRGPLGQPQTFKNI